MTKITEPMKNAYNLPSSAISIVPYCSQQSLRPMLAYNLNYDEKLQTYEIYEEMLGF